MAYDYNNTSIIALNGYNLTRYDQDEMAEGLIKAYMGIISIIAVSIIVTNTLVLIAMYKYTPLQTVTNRFVVSLSLADLLVGSCFIISMSISSNMNLLMDTTMCSFRTVLPQTALMVSLFNLLGIATDRYLAVMWPLHYSSLMRGRTANILIIVMWVYAFCLVVLPMLFTHNGGGLDSCYVEFFLNKYHLCVVFLHYWLGACTMIFIYTRIFRTTSAHIRRLERQNSSYYKNMRAISGDGQQEQNEHDNSPHISQTVKVFSLVFGSFFLCLTPYYTMYTVVAFKYSPEKVEEDFLLSFVWLPLVDVLIALNSTINPYIYAWKYTDFRIAFRNLLCCRSHYQYNTERSNSLYGCNNGQHQNGRRTSAGLRGSGTGIRGYQNSSPQTEMLQQTPTSTPPAANGNASTGGGEKSIAQLQICHSDAELP